MASVAVATTESASVSGGFCGPMTTGGLVSSIASGRRAVERPPRCRATPNASSGPASPPSDNSRQRPSAPNDRNVRGNRSYPTPTDQDPHGSDNALERSEPSPPLIPPTRYGPPSRFRNAGRSAPTPAKLPALPSKRRVTSP